jgi:hypothetical protein
VRLMSLPLLMKTSLLPRISARETAEEREREREGHHYRYTRRTEEEQEDIKRDWNQFASTEAIAAVSHLYLLCCEWLIDIHSRCLVNGTVYLVAFVLLPPFWRCSERARVKNLLRRTAWKNGRRKKTRAKVSKQLNTMTNLSLGRIKTKWAFAPLELLDIECFREKPPDLWRAEMCVFILDRCKQTHKVAASEQHGFNQYVSKTHTHTFSRYNVVNILMRITLHENAWELRSL